MARAVKACATIVSERLRDVRFLVEGQTQELHPIVRDEVYRISREALRNAFTQSRARHIEAEITYGAQLFPIAHSR